MTLTDPSGLCSAAVQSMYSQCESKTTWSSMDRIHSDLDAAGFIPGVGEVADLLNAVAYGVTGDVANAGVSLAGLVPVAGDTVKVAGRAAKRLVSDTAGRVSGLSQSVSSRVRQVVASGDRGSVGFGGVVSDLVPPNYVNGVKNAENAKTLRDNLYSQGESYRPGYAAHHMVPSGSLKPGAVLARKRFSEHGVGINDAVNGVFLPANKKSSNVLNMSVHSKVHTNVYDDNLFELFTVASSKEEIHGILDYIRDQLESGVPDWEGGRELYYE